MKYKGLFDKRPLVLSVFITILLLMTDVILTGICIGFLFANMDAPAKSTGLLTSLLFRLQYAIMCTA